MCVLAPDSVQCANLELPWNNAEGTNLSSGFRSPWNPGALNSWGVYILAGAQGMIGAVTWVTGTIFYKMWKEKGKWSHSGMSDCLWPQELWHTRLLHPWDFPGKSAGVGCHFLLQRIFPTQRPNPGLPHCRETFYCLSHQASLQNVKGPLIFLLVKLRTIELSARPSWVCVQSGLTRCDSVDYSPPGSSAHGICRAGILEWVAISFSRGSSQPGEWTCVSCVCCTGRRILYQCNLLGSRSAWLRSHS